MENQITTVNTNAPAMTDEEAEKTAIRWLESTGNLQKFNQEEKNQFIDICKAFHLNPIKKEAYGVMYIGKDGKRNFSIIVGYEVYLKRAQRSGLLDGFKTEIEKLSDGEMKAVCTIYRKDWKYPFVHEVYLSEYTTGKNLWVSKPITMLKKVAEAQAFRKCFSDELGGIPYTADELPEEMSGRDSTPSTEALAEEALKPAKKVETKKETPAKKYTKEEAEEIGKILKSTYDDGSPIFTEEEILTAKKMLVVDGGKITLEQAQRLLKERTESPDIF